MPAKELTDAGAPAISSQDADIELLGENAPITHDHVTPIAARLDRKHDAVPD